LGYGLPFADLIQEGSVGLMKAVKRFDPTMGVRLVSFAVHWIKAEIHEFIIKNWRMVKIATTKNQRKLFFNLRKMKKRLGWFSKEEVSDVAKTLNVPEKAVWEMEAKLNAYEISFDADEGDDESGYLAPATYLEDLSANPETIVVDDDSSSDYKERMLVAFEKLDERSQIILQKRWLADEKATLHDLAAEFNLSAERIRQLEQMAMSQLRKTIKNND
jgi:RNA polymerase sigma-32 factor